MQEQNQDIQESHNFMKPLLNFQDKTNKFTLKNQETNNDYLKDQNHFTFGIYDEEKQPSIQDIQAPPLS